MHKFLLIIFSILCVCSLLINQAEAKRFGGGKSFGIQRSISNNHSRSTTTTTTKAATPANKWLAPLTGLAAGSLLAYLLMGNGIGAGILSWLAIATVLFLIISFIKNRKHPIMQQVSTSLNSHGTTETPIKFSSFSTASILPPNFDAEAFLRDAKIKFIRLQTAYDQKNLDDLRQFTTPEVYAEIQIQLQERQQQFNQTEVLALQAELLEVTNESNVLLASVNFSGSIRENNQEPMDFSEIWHFKKDPYTPHWNVAGLQQN